MREFHVVSMILRLTLAMICGGFIGIQRAYKGRPAGLRTYMLVCLGAASAMLLGIYETEFLNIQREMLTQFDTIQTDVSRFGAQVINGVGFLGSGTIIVTKQQKVKGITTAAGLWASACMGLAIGSGFYECFLVGFILILISMLLFPRVENAIVLKSRFVNLYIEFSSINAMDEIISKLRSENVHIVDVEISKGAGGKLYDGPNAVVHIIMSKHRSHAELMVSLSALDSVSLIEEI